MKKRKLAIFSIALVLLLTIVSVGCSRDSDSDDSEKEIVTLNLGIDGVAEDTANVEIEVDGEVIKAGEGFEADFEKTDATEVSLKLLEEGDYEFDGWRYSGANEVFDSAEKITITMDKDKNIFAQFSQRKLPKIDKIDVDEDVENIVVEYGTPKAEAKAELVEELVIKDTDENRYEVNLTWQIKNYDSQTDEKYIAIGNFELPDEVEQTDPETKLEVTTIVEVLKEVARVDTVELSGDETIKISDDSEVNKDYSAVVKDQHGRTMDNEELDWSLADVEGSDVNNENVLITDGQLTVRAEASEQENSFKVIATSQSDEEVSDELTITLTEEEPEVTSIDIVGLKSVIIPASGENTVEYDAKVKDQFGNEMLAEEVSWELESEVAGVDIDDTAKVTVDADTNADSFTLIATSETDEDITQNKTVDLEADSVENIEIETQPKLSYTEGEKLDLSDMQVQINWKVAEAEIIDYDYDKLSAEPADGTELSIEDDEKTIAITYDSNENLRTETDELSIDKLMHTVKLLDLIGEGRVKIDDEILEVGETVKIESGKEVTISAEAAEDYQFQKWQINDEKVGSDKNLELKISEDKEIVAKFETESDGRGNADLDLNPETPPEAPENLEVSERDEDSIELDWDNAKEYPEGYIAGYAIYRSVNTGIEERIDQIKGEETAYVDEDIEEVNDYEYRVAAYNKAGYRSSKSEVALSEGEQQEITFYYNLPDWADGEALVTYYSQGDKSGQDIEMTADGDWYTASVEVEDVNSEIEFVLSFMGDDDNRKFLKATGDFDENVRYTTNSSQIWVDSTDISEWRRDDYYLEEDAYFDSRPE